MPKYRVETKGYSHFPKNPQASVHHPNQSYRQPDALAPFHQNNYPNFRQKRQTHDTTPPLTAEYQASDTISADRHSHLPPIAPLKETMGHDILSSRIGSYITSRCANKPNDADSLPNADYRPPKEPSHHIRYRGY